MDAVVDLLAGVLHLGDVLRRDDGGQASRAEPAGHDDESEDVQLDSEAVGSAARLLGLDVDELTSTLRRRKMRVQGRNSFYRPKRTRAQVEVLLHSLETSLYGRLFAWIVRAINAALWSPSHAEPGEQQESVAQMGVLDIYGFESLTRNGLEQLLINLTNERLQRFFVERVLASEQQESVAQMGVLDIYGFE